MSMAFIKFAHKFDPESHNDLINYNHDNNKNKKAQFNLNTELSMSV